MNMFMSRVKGEEEDYEDNPNGIKGENADEIEIVPENIPGYTTTNTSFDLSQTKPSKSSQNHYDRLTKSSSVLNLSLNRSNSDLDDTVHLVKGKGYLASKRDVNVSPIVFAEGCKLLQAAAIGNGAYIKYLLSENPQNIFFRDYDRRTALHVAASEGKLNIVKMLIETYNAPINRSDRWGGSPLDDAHRHRHEAVVAYLRKKGASTGSTDHTMNLITAAVTGDLDELKMLLSNATSTSPEVVGSSSVSNHSAAIISSASVSSSTRKNKTSPNTLAPNTATTTTTYSININAGDYDGRTALHLACTAGHSEVVAFLISCGANVNIVDNWKGTPLDDAIRTGHVDCIHILKKHGAKVGQKTSAHVTETSERTKSNEDRNLMVDFSDLDVIDKIGSGAFGEIFKCRWRGTYVAAKCIKRSKLVDLWRLTNTNENNNEGDGTNGDRTDLSGDELQEAINDFRLETSILRTLRHPNIVMLLGYSRTESFEVMISELMKCSLLDVFSAQYLQGTSLSRTTQMKYAQQLARGMNYLHKCKPPIIHRDLKPANLLIDFSGTLKIADFGLSKVRPDPNAKENQGFRMTGETGSYRFMAPEVFRHEEYTETVDIYSFAMILYYLVSGRPPWESLSGLKAVIKAAVEADRPIIHRSWDAQISSLMQRCWDENPTGRPSFSVILDQLNNYSKNVLKVDLDNLSGDESRGCNCVIS
mmetsp:Transcript_8465/g.9756  ORF Transcript_8465/g.9756 Transcript_8465/m.9756 type:complete len:703 (+) Transcript_8465:108-2216(+)